jgi:hypothetical protein
MVPPPISPSHPTDATTKSSIARPTRPRGYRDRANHSAVARRQEQLGAEIGMRVWVGRYRPAASVNGARQLQRRTSHPWTGWLGRLDGVVMARGPRYGTCCTPRLHARYPIRSSVLRAGSARWRRARLEGGPRLRPREREDGIVAGFTTAENATSATALVCVRGSGGRLQKSGDGVRGHARTVSGARGHCAPIWCRSRAAPSWHVAPLDGSRNLPCDCRNYPELRRQHLAPFPVGSPGRGGEAPA